MNAREQEKAQAAEQRYQEDVRDTVIEGIGDLLYRRSRRVSKPKDNLADLHIRSREDVLAIARWVEAELETELMTTKFDLSEILTVDQLSAAIAGQLTKSVNL